MVATTQRDRCERLLYVRWSHGGSGKGRSIKNRGSESARGYLFLLFFLISYFIFHVRKLVIVRIKREGETNHEHKKQEQQQMVSQDHDHHKVDQTKPRTPLKQTTRTAHVSLQRSDTETNVAQDDPISHLVSSTSPPSRIAPPTPVLCPPLRPISWYPSVPSCSFLVCPPRLRPIIPSQQAVTRIEEASEQDEPSFVHVYLPRGAPAPPGSSRRFRRGLRIVVAIINRDGNARGDGRRACRVGVYMEESEGSWFLAATRRAYAQETTTRIHCLHERWSPEKNKHTRRILMPPGLFWAGRGRERMPDSSRRCLPVMRLFHAFPFLEMRCQI
ncbi:hypothetical protein MUK42_19591 [Musa troglodytarum]|uniref:Uncharacterized protein n=1 Tax=Musa troglodytarum TaxID=320322 RepID=A0A9E7K0C7_9LILI|nr:hypothetical protein MUK42_19591 [Musa troglodytarum]